MIGKSRAQQMINEYLAEIGYFIKNNKRGYNLPTKWKTSVINHINFAAHVVFTNDDAKVEMESLDSQDGLKFTYLRLGLGIKEGASVFYNQSQ